MTSSRKAQRGSAMLLTMGVASVILIVVLGLMTYANNERVRSIGSARRTIRMSCAEAGLQLARGYYGRNFTQWNAFLGSPNLYNHSLTANTLNPPLLDIQNPAFQVTAPLLFADLDGDGLPDVYLYIRDNQDETPPAIDDPTKDVDQNVIVGAVCVSSTMVPRMQDGTLSPNLQMVEGLLSYNGAPFKYSQANTGTGTGNLNPGS